MVRGETRRAEVDDLDFAAGVGLDQDVLGLEVAVNEAEPVHEDKRLQAPVRARGGGVGGGGGMRG